MAAKKAGKRIAVFGPAKIRRGQICVLVVPHETYSKHLLGITKEAARAYNAVCYVTLNKPHATLLLIFEENGIDWNRFYFIDPVTKAAAPSTFPKNVTPVESISAITGLSIAISNVLEKKKTDGLILDSLSTMLVYNDESSITKFIHFLVGKLRTLGCAGILTILENDAKSRLIQDIGMFVDSIIYLGKKKK